MIFKFFFYFQPDVLAAAIPNVDKMVGLAGAVTSRSVIVSIYLFYYATCFSLIIVNYLLFIVNLI